MNYNKAEFSAAYGTFSQLPPCERIEIAFAGRSNVGKSTLINVISGLDSYEEGEMYIDGNETSHFTVNDFENYRRKYIANIFQSFNLVSSYTVFQNVELVLLVEGKRNH